MEDNQKEKPKKFRYFAFIVYQTDKAGNVQYQTRDELARRLRLTYGDFAISPLHQPDEDYDGLHWHVVYRHPNPVRLDVARSFLDGIPYNNFVLCLHHPRNYQRYLIHMDNPEKEQFEGFEKAIEVVNNFPLDLSRDMSEKEKLEIQMEIECFAEEYNIFEYAQLCKFLREKTDYEHYRYFSTHTHHFGKFLDSLRHSADVKGEGDINA